MDLLSQLANKHRTDKGPWHHNYTPVYDSYLHPLRHQALTLLEIGIGGYEYPDRGGESLKMWAEYFTHAHIVGIDIHDKSQLVFADYIRERVKTFKGSQTDVEFLSKLITIIGQPNIILDDGSHKNADNIKTFNLLFPALQEGGIYIIEDTETSYWKEEYGGNPWICNRDITTTTGYFQSLTDILNYEKIPNYPTDPNDVMVSLSNHIKSIHFYKNIIIIFKN